MFFVFFCVFQLCMGRALFSQRYLPGAAACDELLPAVPPLGAPCQRWGPCNQFDPDSEDFFKNAQLEQFLDGLFDSPAWTLGRTSPPHPAVVGDTNPSPTTTTSSNDSDDSLSDAHQSPMAVGADDPASLLDAYVPADVQHFPQDEPRRQSRSTRRSSRRPSSLHHPEDPLLFHQTPPPPDFTTSAPHSASSPSTAVSTAQSRPEAQQAAGTSRSPVVRRTVNITPINIPSQPAPASPPATSAAYPDNTTNPFPLRNALPRFYTWTRDLYL